MEPAIHRRWQDVASQSKPSEMHGIIVGVRDLATQKITSIQALRAFAALLVVYGHSKAGAIDAFGYFSAPTLGTGAGVDLFFVISGFIIVFSSERLFMAERGSLRFLARRLARIVPLYWLAITIWILSKFDYRSLSLPYTLDTIWLSYLFIPHVNTITGHVVPVLSLGWSLNYEMLFYIIFTPFVMFSRNIAASLVMIFIIGISIIGLVVPYSNLQAWYWSRPIVTEFAMGIALAIAMRNGVQLSELLRGLIFVAALGLYFVDPFGLATTPNTPNDWTRVASWGVPAGLIFAAVVLGPDPMPRLLEKGSAVLGDASYSLYLFHPIVLGVAKVAFTKLNINNPWLFIFISIALSSFSAIVIHHYIEKPIVNRLQGRNSKKSVENPVYAS